MSQSPLREAVVAALEALVVSLAFAAVILVPLAVALALVLR